MKANLSLCITKISYIITRIAHYNNCVYSTYSENQFCQLKSNGLMNLLHYNYCIEMWTERLQCVYMYILWLTVDIMRLTSAGISLNLRIKACLTQSTKISAPNTITASGRITHTCSKHKNTTNFLVNTWKEAVNKFT